MRFTLFKLTGTKQERKAILTTTVVRTMSIRAIFGRNDNPALMNPPPSFPSSRRINRRQFIGQSAVVGAGVPGFPAILRSASPNSVLQVASVGAGGMAGDGCQGVNGCQP
jgi:hypothetical protein